MVYFAAVVLVITVMLVLSYFLGQRHHNRAMDSPYESGVLATGTARVRLSADFYLVAIFFVIFDLEFAYLFVWSTVVREVGWTGYVGVCAFVSTLLAGLIYLWRMRALDY